MNNADKLRALVAQLNDEQQGRALRILQLVFPEIHVPDREYDPAKDKMVGFLSDLIEAEEGEVIDLASHVEDILYDDMPMPKVKQRRQETQ